jgi:hypothetical protein
MFICVIADYGTGDPAFTEKLGLELRASSTAFY